VDFELGYGELDVVVDNYEVDNEEPVREKTTNRTQGDDLLAWKLQRLTTTAGTQLEILTKSVKCTM
jgi:hypothetical protein